MHGAAGVLSKGMHAINSAIDNAAYKAGEFVNDKTNQLGAPPEVSAGLGAATNVAAQTIPMMVGGELGARAIPVLQDAGRWMMTKAVKPMLQDVTRGKAAPAIETMLQRGYSPTNAGVQAMRDKAGGYMDEVASIIEPSTKAVTTTRAEQNAQSLAERLKEGTLGAQKQQDVEAVVRALKNHEAVDTAGTMSVQNAQKMKQANYRDIGDRAYGLSIKEQAERDALKAVNAGIRKAIEEAHPAVGPLNEKAGELISAAKIAQRRAIYEGNKDIMPLGAGIATAAHNPLAALGLYANSSAYVKSLLARTVYSGAEGAPGVGRLAGAAAGAYSGTTPKDDKRAAALIEALKQMEGK